MFIDASIDVQHEIIKRYLDQRIADKHLELEQRQFRCMAVKGHYGSITARSADQLYACSCDACEAEAEMRLLLRERKKFL